MKTEYDYLVERLDFWATLVDTATCHKPIGQFNICQLLELRDSLKWAREFIEVNIENSR